MATAPHGRGSAWLVPLLVLAALAARGRGWLLALPALTVLGTATAVAAWTAPPLRALEESGGGLAGPWRIRATIVDPPRPTLGGAGFRVRAREVLRDGAWAPTDGIVAVGLPSLPRQPLPAGAGIEVFLALRSDRAPANVGLPRRDRLGVRGIDLRARLKSDLQIRVLSPGARSSQGAERLRGGIRSVLDRRLGARAGEAAALTLGERGGMDDASMIRLARSGLVHLFAISGLHVGLVAAGAAALARMAGASPRVSALAATGAALALAAVVAPAAPIRRAALMAVALGSGIASGRRHGAAAALGLAVLLLAWLDPRAVHAPGFQMSTLATAGLVLALGRPVSDARPRRMRDLLLASVIAQAWVAPVVAASGAAVPLAALALNPVAVPLLAVALALIAAAIGLDGPAPAAAAFTGRGAETALDGLDALAAFGARGPAFFLDFGVALALLWWAALLLLVRSGRRAPRLAASVALVAIAAGAAVPPAPGADPRLHVLDVGQGDALHLGTAPGHVLIDGGGFPGLDYDVGAHLVVPALARLGVRHLDRVALSHPHVDHSGGLAAAVAAMRPTELWLGVHPPGDRQVEELRAAGGYRTATLLPRGPARPQGACPLRTLLPAPRARATGLRRADNEASLVLIAACPEVDVWLTGDAGEASEPIWPVPPGRRTLLKVGHHGSASATSASFLDRLRPRHAVISVGARNSFGLPRAEVLRRLRERGIAVYRTDRDGALRITLGDRVRVRGERWAAGG